MKKGYTFLILLSATVAAAQVPTNFGTTAEDGIAYQTYNLINHGTVSSVRFMAQNAIDAGDANWEFFTGNYEDNWRPYTADDTLSGYDAIIDPALETSSARYNSAFAGQSGKLQAIQAGYYYTSIISLGVAADNFMSIIETDFNPVVIDTIFHFPENPLTTDDIVLTVELDGSLVLSAGERLFIRSSVDGWVTSQFAEVTNFSGGVGTFTIAGNLIPAGTTVTYYALVTKEDTPVHETIDYFTLFFGNNDGANYTFTVSTVIGIEDVAGKYGFIRNANEFVVSNVADLISVELVSISGKQIQLQTVAAQQQLSISTQGLSSGIYVLNFNGKEQKKSIKFFVD